MYVSPASAILIRTAAERQLLLISIIPFGSAREAVFCREVDQLLIFFSSQAMFWPRVFMT